MQGLILTTILILSTLLRLGAGLNVGMGDDDKKTTEMSGVVKMSVTASEVTGSVIVEVIPMTVDEYVTESGDTDIFEAIGEPYDPAESDLDFNSSIHTILIERNGEYDFEVDIIDDTISEFEESFILFLRVVNTSDPNEDVVITQRWSIVRIRVDNLDAYHTSISLVVVNSTLNENDGVVPYAAYIEVEGSIESTITLDLSIPDSAKEDIRLVKTEIPIPPNETRVPVALELLDDSIAELPEVVNLFMSIRFQYFKLLSRRGNNIGAITIEDDDVPVVGFEEDTSHSTLFEGQTTEVCVILSEPDTVERILSFEISYESNSDLSLSGELDFGFYAKPYKHCFNVTFADNDVIDYPLEAVFSLHHFDSGFFPSLNPVLQPSNIVLTIQDDDGVPLEPTDIWHHYFNDNKDVLITWKSEITDLQTIDGYEILASSELFITSTVERRHAKDDGLSSFEFEYYTPWTHFLIEGLDQLPSISVQVCAVNSLGRTCSDPPLEISYIEPTTVPPTKIGTASGLQDPEKSGLELKYLIPIIVLPALLAIVCFILLLMAIVACCVCMKSRSKHYYPARQEQRMGSTRRSFAEGRCVNQPAIIVTYKMRETPSTESVDWIEKPSEENGMWNQIKRDLELSSEDNNN